MGYNWININVEIHLKIRIISKTQDDPVKLINEKG